MKKVVRTHWLSLVKALYKEYVRLIQALRAMKNPATDDLLKKIDKKNEVTCIK